MATTVINFGEWLPDQPGVTGSLTQAENCIPVANGYEPLHSEANFSSAAADTLLTTFAGKFAGVSTLFAVSSQKIYKYNGTTIALDPINTTGYTATESWDVTQFGSRVILANGKEKLQSIILNVGSSFADLSADAPVAKYVTVVRDFVVAGNAAGYENKLYWCDINDPTDWTPDATSQADSQVIPDGGDILGLTGGEFGIVLLERAIYRMSYVGSPLFFQFDAISRSQGCFAAGSVVQYKNLTYFLASDGFYACDGQSVESISSQKINKWFFDNAAVNDIDSISATVDPIRELIIWCFPSQAGGNFLLFYSVPLQRWSYATTSANAISVTITPSVTLESLDNYSISIDALTVSLDDRQWAGGNPIFSGVSGGRIVTFSGANKTASIISGDINIGRSVMTLARPIVDMGSGSVAVAARNLLSDDITFTDPVAADAEGRCSIRQAGRYIRVETIPTGDDWKTAVGVQVDVINQGAR
jgi:hypothetical protein